MYYICPFCGVKKSDKMSPPVFRSKNMGICRECDKAMPLTPPDGCFEGTAHMDYVISPLFYSGTIKRAMHKYKFYHNFAFSKLLAFYITRVLKRHSFISDYDILVPVPVSKKRFLERGYNQSALIAEIVAEEMNIAYSGDILTKPVNTVKQSLLGGARRAANVLNAFSADANLDGMKIIVLDDIFTTGSTMDEAARTLKAAGAEKVVGIAASIVKRKTFS